MKITERSEPAFVRMPHEVRDAATALILEATHTIESAAADLALDADTMMREAIAEVIRQETRRALCLPPMRSRTQRRRYERLD